MSSPWIPDVDYERHPAYRDLPRSLSRKLLALRRLAKPFLQELLYGLKARPRRTVDRTKPLPPGAPAILEDLSRDGIAAIRIPADAKSRLRSLRDQIKASGAIENVASDTTGRHYRGRPSGCQEIMDAFDREVNQICETLGIKAAAEAYLGRRVVKTKLSYQYDEAGPIKKNVFDDPKFPDPSTLYMHIDTAWGCLNCIVYLDDVEPRDGPYRFLPASHRRWPSFLDLVIRKAVHKSRLQKWGRVDRELFINLPTFLRRKAEFGNDLLDSSEDSRLLLEKEVIYTSDRGDFIISDNVSGIHRGILLGPSGHRENLTFDLLIE